MENSKKSKKKKKGIKKPLNKEKLENSNQKHKIYLNQE